MTSLGVCCTNSRSGPSTSLESVVPTVGVVLGPVWGPVVLTVGVVLGPV